MKDTQNITLALPKALLRRAKRVAADRDTSVSALLAESLATAVNEGDRYAAGRRRYFARARAGADLGTRGRSAWTRDALHER